MLSRVEEIKLIARCALADNRDAFGQLVEAYRSDVTRFLLNLTMGDDALSDDLAQETFIKAYLGIRSFKGISRLRTWLYRIAYNEYYSWLRKRHEERLDDDNGNGHAITVTAATCRGDTVLHRRPADKENI